MVSLRSFTRVVGLGVALTTAAGSAFSSEKLETFSNDYYGLSFQYPAQGTTVYAGSCGCAFDISIEVPGKLIGDIDALLVSAGMEDGGVAAAEKRLSSISTFLEKEGMKSSITRRNGPNGLYAEVTAAGPNKKEFVSVYVMNDVAYTITARADLAHEREMGRIRDIVLASLKTYPPKRSQASSVQSTGNVPTPQPTPTSGSKWFSVSQNGDKCIESNSPAYRMQSIRDIGYEARTKEFRTKDGALLGVEVYYAKGLQEQVWTYWKSYAACMETLEKANAIPNEYR